MNFSLSTPPKPEDTSFQNASSPLDNMYLESEPSYVYMPRWGLVS